MGSFGERLRREREMRGITIEEIAAATKIGTRSLRALEDEEFRKLPGGIFNKGFVRAYAKFLGINEEQAVADYLAASGEPDEPAEINAAQLIAQREDIEAQSKAASKRAKELQSIQSDGPSGFPWMALVGLAIIIALAWGGRAGFYRYKQHREAKVQAQREAEARAQAQTQAERIERERQQQQAMSQAQTALEGASTVQGTPGMSSTAVMQTGTTPTTPESAPAKTEKPPAEGKKATDRTADPGLALAPANLTISVHARQRAWISVTADGKHVTSGELAPSAQRSFQARSQLVLVLGNAGGTDVTFNGKVLPSLGDENKYRKVTFEANGTYQ